MLSGKETVTFNIIDFAIGDVITSFPALYQISRDRKIAIWFQNPKIRALWSGPDIQLLDQKSENGNLRDYT